MRIGMVLWVVLACGRDDRVEAPALPKIDAPALPEIDLPGNQQEGPLTYDGRFIDAMIAYATFTEDLADVGDRRAQDDTLEVFSENMAKEHDTTVAQLKNWRQLWFGEATPRTTDFDEASRIEGDTPYDFGVAFTGVTVVRDADRPRDVEGVAVTTGVAEWDSEHLLAALREVPAQDFDRVYTTALITHHQWAVDAAKAAEGRLGREELESVARELATTNEAHVRRLRDIQGKLGTPPARTGGPATY